MAWTYEVIQLEDSEGNLLPLFKIVQWNTDDPNTKYESTITEKVKDVCYGN
jgi:hypothetical protein